MVIKPMKIYRPRHRPARGARKAVPPVGPLTLVAASYEPGAYVELTFDRAIDIAGIVPSTVLLSDGDVMGFFYEGSDEAFLMGPTVLRMTVGAGNGVVASGDGAAWAGVMDLELPFG